MKCCEKILSYESKLIFKRKPQMFFQILILNKILDTFDFENDLWISELTPDLPRTPNLTVNSF